MHLAEIDMLSADDSEVLDRAQSEERILITADTDFGAILAERTADSPSLYSSDGEPIGEPSASRC